LLVPENSDTSLSQEFDSVKVWFIVNKMVINYAKTKELVFCRPSPFHELHPNPIDGIEQVNEAKILGVLVNRRPL
jgi:hypothetical protein